MKNRIMIKKPQRIGVGPVVVLLARPAARPALFYLLELRSRVAANETKKRTWRINLEPASQQDQQAWPVAIIQKHSASRSARRRSHQ